MLQGEVGRRSRIVATGVLVERVDACDVWAEVLVEKPRGTTSVVTLQDHTCLAEMLPVNVYCIFKGFWLSPSSRTLYMGTAFMAIIVPVILRVHALSLGVLTKCIGDVSIMD